MREVAVWTQAARPTSEILERARRAPRSTNGRARRPLSLAARDEDAFSTHAIAPIARTSFVGRAREIARIDAVLRAGARLVTIVGPPGVGKTRLVSHHLERFAVAQEHLFVDLSSARMAEDVVASVARALDLPLQGASLADGVRRVASALAAQGPLLVALDNFESVLEEAAPILGRWLDATTPDTRFVVTSRSVLGLYGEERIDLAPLGLPPPERTDLEAVLGSEAGQLFRDRAQGYPFREEQAALLAELFRRLDGIPLALELCARRLKLLSPEALVARLSQRFELLAQGPRDVASRHRTLEAAVLSSWRALAPWERSALAQLSVFCGRFGVAAAEMVVRLPQGAPPVLEVLHGLVDKSLLRIDRDGPWLVFYEIIRELALRAGASEGLRRSAHERRLAYRRQLAAALEAAIDGPGELAAIAELEPELDDFLDACRAAKKPRAARRHALWALEILVGLAPIVMRRLPIDSYLALLDQLLERALEAAPRSLRARALAVRAEASMHAGRVDDARSSIACALRLAGPSEHGLQASLELLLVSVSRLTGEVGHARPAIERALAHARRASDLVLEARCSRELGLLKGEPRERTRGDVERAIDLAERAGAVRLTAVLHADLVFADAASGRPDDALARYRRALPLFRQIGDRQSEGYASMNVATALEDAGRLDEAHEHVQSALATARFLSNQRLEGCALDTRADAHHAAADLDAAERDYRAAIRLFDEVRCGDKVVECTAKLAMVLVTEGRVEDAQRELATASAGARHVGNPLLTPAVELAHAYLELSQSLHALSAGDLAAARESRRSASLRIAAASTGYQDWTRFPRRLLEQLVARHFVRIEPDGASFCRDGEQAVSLARRASLKRLLALLAQRYERSPGEPVSFDELVDAGWPGERILVDAATTRLQVAVSSLRRLGLKDAIIARGGGYLLDPRTPVLVFA